MQPFDSRNGPAYCFGMASLNLKDIPAEIHERLKSSADSNFRSITQEAFARLQLSFNVEEVAVTKLHQSFIDQAIASGPARPARKNQLAADSATRAPAGKGEQAVKGSFRRSTII